MKKTVAIVCLVLGILLIAGLSWMMWMSWKGAPAPTSNTPTQAVSADDQVSQVVTQFGNVMKNVPLSGTREIASDAMDQNYAPYLSATLLVQWKDDPSQALGRLTSSPWPDHIVIQQVTQVNANSYLVSGYVIEKTSEDIAKGTEGSRDPIKLNLENQGGHWLITSATLESSSDNQHQSADQALYEQHGVFTIAYPMNFQVATDSIPGGYNLDLPLVGVTVPDSVISPTGTNYVESYLVISESTNTQALDACTSFLDIDPHTSTTQVDVNGVTFNELDYGGAAAGNFYSSKLYRTAYENACYEVALTVHTGNIGNYDPAVKPFDEAQAFNVLQPIFQSFRFE